MISPKLSKVYRSGSPTGAKFHGLFTDPEDRFEGDELRARRILRTHARSNLATGGVVWAEEGTYLLFEHSSTRDEVRFLAFEVTHRLAWVRSGKSIDPVTKMARGDVDQTLHPNLPVTVEPTGVVEVQGIERNRYVIRAPGVFQKGDRIGPYTAQTVQVIHGASIIGAV
tara:strand:+ start:1254 stop:1760 length:507 start_codon:yes stop_codon:yes gene_type:complete